MEGAGEAAGGAGRAAGGTGRGTGGVSKARGAARSRTGDSRLGGLVSGGDGGVDGERFILLFNVSKVK
jgi:hypothetical protein